MSTRNAIIGLLVFVIVVLGLLYFANRYGGGIGSPAPVSNTSNGFFNSTTGTGGNRSATTTGSGGSGNQLTTPAALSARAVLASRLNTSVNNVTITDVEAANWPNGCLGLARPGEMCTQAITAGYRVTLTSGGKEYVYRTNASGSAARLEQ